MFDRARCLSGWPASPRSRPDGGKACADPQAPFAAHSACPFRQRRGSSRSARGFFIVVRRSPQAHEFALATAGGQNPEVAHPHQSLGHDVHLKATNELRSFQGQRLVPVMIGIVLVAQDQALGVDPDNPGIGDRDPVGIARQVLNDAFGML